MRMFGVGELIELSPSGPGIGGMMAFSGLGLAPGGALNTRVRRRQRVAALHDRREPYLRMRRGLSGGCSSRGSVGLAGLGALGSDSRNEVERIVAQLDASELAFAEDLADATAEGHDVLAPTRQHELIVQQLVQLTSEAASLGEDGLSQFRARAQTVAANIAHAHSDVSDLRRGARHSEQIKMVLYGAGGLALAGVVVWSLVKVRKTRRRRR
jgi:hypothetical protein